MDEALLWLRRIASIVLLPLAAVATIALVLVVALFYYLRAVGVALFSFLGGLFRAPSPTLQPLPGPHFHERAALPKR